MPDANVTPSAWPPRRLARWTGIAAALIAVGWAAWYFGVELPDRKEAAAAAALQAANARSIPDLNLDLVYIAPGEFLMGTPEQSLIVKWYYLAREKLTKKPNPGGGFDNERPVTWVTLTQPFWLGRTAVTQGQYQAVMGTNPSHFTAAGREAPVEQVSWDDAIAFCAKLTDREKAAGRLPTGYAYTLPTEAQREYACRAGTTGDYAGDLDAMAWYNANSGNTTHPVGTKQPNAWGLYDMHGNVWEWCRDWYADKLPGGEVTNPLGLPSGSLRVFRGGSWRDGAAGCRSAFRFGVVPGVRGLNVGFRLALSAVR
jgi:formylglycine-generating enzyme required for sulfatase activity